MIMQTTKEKSICTVKQNKKNTNDISEKAISMHTLINLFILKSFLPSSLGTTSFPGSLFQRLREEEKRDPGNEVGLGNNGGSTKLIGLMVS